MNASYSRRRALVPSLVIAAVVMTSGTAFAHPSATQIGAAAPAAPAAGAGAAPSPASSGGGGLAGPQNSAGILVMSKKTLFVLAFGGDPATTNFLTYEVTERLQPFMLPGADNDERWIIPEPAWSLGDFATQCESDPQHTLGALVLYDVENDSGSYNYLLFLNGYAHLYPRALLIRCEPFRKVTPAAYGTTSVSVSTVVSDTPAQPPNPPPAPAVTTTVAEESVSPFKKTTTKTSPPPVTITTTESTNVTPVMTVTWRNTGSIDGAGHQGSVPFLGLAALGTYLASHTSTQTATTTTTTPTTPNTTTQNGSVAETKTTTSNNSQLPYGVALVASSVSQLGSINFGGMNGTKMLKGAAARVASRLARQMAASCTAECGTLFDLKRIEAEVR